MQLHLGKGFVKKVKKRVPWIEHIVSDAGAALDLNYSLEETRIRVPTKSLCIACRGARMLCRKPRCPIVVKLYSYLKTKPLIDATELEGSSPPGVFVGRIGYPYVFAGPLIPPIRGDTSLFDMPEQWLDRKIDEIVDFRLKLVRGKFRVNVKKAEAAGKLMDQSRELALSAVPVDAEAKFGKKPGKNFIIDGELQPFGPSAQLKELTTGNIKFDHKIEKAYRDTDLKALDAVLDLYKDNVPVSRIQRAFSIGAFGIEKQRRLVPTRWSITAVDSNISRILRDKAVKRSPVINEYRVYESDYLDNRFVVLMMPSAWSYEAVEAWYPGTSWNPSSPNIAICGDWEGYEGRTTYAEIGGCYYAARLAVTEYLSREKRQASVVVLREAHPGYILPVGVWQVRENVRSALRRDFKKFETIKESLDHISKRLDIKLNNWVDSSRLLENELHQERLTKFLSRSHTR